MAGFKFLAAATLLFGTAFAQTSDTVNADGKYTIQAEGIRANFIPYGASISNLFINDTNGIERDIVLGFDNASYYSVDKLHPHLGGVPGRYANRIKNSSFTIDGTTYNVTSNENLATAPDTLHGGPDGWDWRNWTVVAHTTDSITFSLFDPDGKEGFPGDVVSYVTYTLTPNAWHLKMYATPLTKTTPIMLSSHTYWNLDGFQNNNTATALNFTLHLPYSGQRIGCDGNLIPTGEILPNQAGSVNDFWTAPKQIGADFPEALGNCGTGCRGYDTCFLINRAQEGPYDWRAKGPVATLGSDFSGIQIDIFTDQEAFQVYSCGGMNGTMALKNTQGFFDDPSRPRVVEQYGCVVMEVEDWIDAINQPEWGRSKRNIFGPKDDPYTLEAVYKFSVKTPSTPSYKELIHEATPTSKASNAIADRDQLPTRTSLKREPLSKPYISRSHTALYCTAVMEMTNEEHRLYGEQVAESLPFIMHQSNLLQTVMSMGGDAIAHDMPPAPPLPPSMRPATPEAAAATSSITHPAIERFTDAKGHKRTRSQRALQDITALFEHEVESEHEDEDANSDVSELALDNMEYSSGGPEDLSFLEATPFQIFVDADCEIPASSEVDYSSDGPEDLSFLEATPFQIFEDADCKVDAKVEEPDESGRSDDDDFSGSVDEVLDDDELRQQDLLHDTKGHLIFDDLRAGRPQNSVYAKAAALGQENIPPPSQFLRDLATDAANNGQSGVWWLQDILSHRLMGWYDVGLETYASHEYYPQLRKPRIHKLLGLVFYKRDTNEGKQAGKDQELFRIFGHEVSNMQMYDIDSYAEYDAHEAGKKRWAFFRIEELASLAEQRDGSNPWAMRTPPCSSPPPEQPSPEFGRAGGHKRHRASTFTAQEEPVAWQMLAFPVSAITAISERTEVANVPVPERKAAAPYGDFASFYFSELSHYQAPPTALEHLASVALAREAAAVRGPLAPKPVRPVNAGNFIFGDLAIRTRPAPELAQPGLPTASVPPPHQPETSGSNQLKRSHEQATDDTALEGHHAAIDAALAHIDSLQPEPLSPAPSLDAAPSAINTGNAKLAPQNCRVTSLHFQKGGHAPLMDGQGIDAFGFWLPFIVAAAGGEARIDVYTAEDEVELGFEEAEKGGEEPKDWQKEMMKGMFGEDWEERVQ